MSALGNFEAQLLALERKVRGADARLTGLEVRAGKAVARGLNQSWVLGNVQQGRNCPMTVSGTVVDLQGTPWGGLFVQVRDQTTGNILAGAAVNSDGTFRLAVTGNSGTAVNVVVPVLNSTNQILGSVPLILECGQNIVGNLQAALVIPQCPGISLGSTASAVDSVYGNYTLVNSSGISFDNLHGILNGFWTALKLVNFPGAPPCPPVANVPYTFGFGANVSFSISHPVTSAPVCPTTVGQPQTTNCLLTGTNCGTKTFTFLDQSTIPPRTIAITFP